MSHQEHGCVGSIRCEQLIEEFEVRLYLRGQGHGRCVGKRTVTTNERGQAQVRVSEDGCGRIDFVIDCVQKRHVKVEQPGVSWSSRNHMSVEIRVKTTRPSESEGTRTWDEK